MSLSFLNDSSKLKKILQMCQKTSQRSNRVTTNLKTRYFYLVILL